MATTVKIVARHPSTVHLRLISTRKYSRKGDSCGGVQGCNAGAWKSKGLAGETSRIIEAFAFTKGPESIKTPQQTLDVVKSCAAGRVNARKVLKRASTTMHDGAELEPFLATKSITFRSF